MHLQSLMRVKSFQRDQFVSNPQSQGHKIWKAGNILHSDDVFSFHTRLSPPISRTFLFCPKLVQVLQWPMVRPARKAAPVSVHRDLAQPLPHFASPSHFRFFASLLQAQHRFRVIYRNANPTVGRDNGVSATRHRIAVTRRDGGDRGGRGSRGAGSAHSDASPHDNARE
jgi:hypothetical protein